VCLGLCRQELTAARQQAARLELLGAGRRPASLCDWLQHRIDQAQPSIAARP
jgi:hypothetical protein